MRSRRRIHRRRLFNRGRQRPTIAQQLMHNPTFDPSSLQKTIAVNFTLQCKCKYVLTFAPVGMLVLRVSTGLLDGWRVIARTHASNRMWTVPLFLALLLLRSREQISPILVCDGEVVVHHNNNNDNSGTEIRGTQQCSSSYQYRIVLWYARWPKNDRWQYYNIVLI